MKLLLLRQPSGPKATIGELLSDGAHLFWTLEDVVREVKIPHQTAIPFGTYEVVINFSERFQRPMPLLLGVPGFSGVRIHYGNTDVDTDGCILLGMDRINADFIGRSREAFSLFFIRLETSLKKGKCLLTIDRAIPK